MEKSFVIYQYLVTLGPELHSVGKPYQDLTSLKGVKVTKYDAYHLLSVLRKAHLIARDKPKGGHFVFLPSLFFTLSHEYSRKGFKASTADFIEKSLKQRGIGWCFNDFMSFVESYGDIISIFFGIVDSVYLRQNMNPWAALLLHVASEVAPEPYAYGIPSIESSLYEKIELSRKALEKVYECIKVRVAQLTSEYSGSSYINARNIASATLFYILVSEGVKRILYYHYDKPDPHLALLYALNEGFAEYHLKWKEFTLGGNS